MRGAGREKAQFERANPELGGGERSKARVRKGVNMGSGDASDATEAESCIISIMKGFGGYHVQSRPPPHVGFEFPGQPVTREVHREPKVT